MQREPFAYNSGKKEVISLERGYKFRLYPNKQQEELIRKTFGCTRFVYNHMLSTRKTAYDKDKTSLSCYDCIKMLPALKGEYPWLKEVDSTALQAATENLDKAYKRFFDQVKARKKDPKAPKPSYPVFKRKHCSRASYTAKMNIAVTDSAVKLPKLGWVRAKISTPVHGRILRAVVSMSRSGKFFVSLCCTKVEIPQLPSTGAVAGLDVGIKDLVITSDGQKFDNPKWLKQSEKKLAKLQRQLSRKSKGSRNRDKARVRLARQYEKVSDQRKDYLHKLTSQLVRDYDVICVENLNVTGMMQNHCLAKAIADCAWGELCRQLKYKTEWQHKALVEIGTFFPSSQLCGTCGYKNPGVKDLDVREWVCPNCGAHHDRVSTQLKIS